MKPSSIQRRLCSSGFTLLELLLGIVLVAVLAALLYTVTGRLAAKGRETACAGRLRQLSLAFQLYTAEHKGRFFDDRSWSKLLNPYIGKEISGSWQSNGAEAARLAITCPEINALRPRNAFSGLYAVNYTFINAIDGPMVGQPPSDWPLQVQNVPVPGKAWVFTEAGRRTAAGSYEVDPVGYIAPGNLSSRPVPGVASLIWPHEGQRKNFAFLDGRVQSMTWLEVNAFNGLSSSSPAYREFHGRRAP